MCVVVCFRWQYVLLGLLDGNVCCCMFQVAMCVVGSFRWQSELMYFVGGNVCCCMF